MSFRNSVVENAVERNSWGKSRNELSCRFHNSGGLHRFSGDAPLETQILTHNRNDHDLYSQILEGIKNSVVEYDVEHNSCEKSKNELSFRFHNSNGQKRFCGHEPREKQVFVCNQTDHETRVHIRNQGYEDLYFDNADTPSYCHTYKAATPSSLRTREAAIAFKKEATKPIKRNTKHKRERNTKKKTIKQKHFLKDIMPPSNKATSNVKFLTINDITKGIVVCDGGKTENDGITPTLKDINYLRIRNGDLWVADTCNAALGLRHIPKYDTFPTFIRLPRRESLQIFNDSRELCEAMRLCALTQRQSLTRGKQRRVYSNSKNKYCCVGVQPGRNVRGVISGHHKIQQGFTSKQWDILLNTLKKAEHAFDKYVNTDVIRHITCAKSRINFATMVPTASSAKYNPSRYYSGLGFGLNVHLRAHTDNDFTMSIVQAHLDTQKYNYNDPVVCYFAFPRLGMAVALRPGDYLLFNPQEYHCISSRCEIQKEIYSISSYLKTAIVGLNDNSNHTV